MTRTIRPASRARVTLFIAGTFTLAALGGFAVAQTTGEPGQPDAQESAAALLFILSPIVMACALRWTGDGWGDAGLRLRARGNGGWYALAVVLYPALAVLTLGAGALAGEVSVAPEAWGPLAAAFGGGLAIRGLYAAFEEFGWRGYLEPRLAALGVPPFRRHLMVGLIWGVWHVPYILVFDTYSELATPVYLALFVVATVPMAFIYGVMRDRTGTVWPAVVMHGVANATAFAILFTDGVEVGAGTVFAARPEGVVMLVATTVVAILIWRRHGRVDLRRDDARERPDSAMDAARHTGIGPAQG